MQNIYDKFIELMASFEKNEVEYVLIGGMAINLHGFARNTEDIDLFISPTKNNVDNVRKSLNTHLEIDQLDLKFLKSKMSD